MNVRRRRKGVRYGRTQTKMKRERSFKEYMEGRGREGEGERERKKH